MTKETQKQYSSPNYHTLGSQEEKESESLFSKFMDKARNVRGKMRDRKVGRKVVAGALAAGAVWGVGEATSTSNERDRQEAVAVGKEFKTAIEPAAAKEGYEKSPQDGYMVKDSDDPSKYSISFHHTFKDGSTYKITATVGETLGENNQSKPDTSKVKRAELTEKNDHKTSMHTFELKDNVMDGESQWVASGVVATKGMDAIGSTTEYDGSVYLDKDGRVESAKRQAADVSEELAAIAKKTASDN